MIALLEAHRAGLYARAQWLPNLAAGVVVGVVALPLAMAFAIASGARPEQGIYTAIIAGGLVSAFGGSRVQIAGPTGAFIAILAVITAKYGIGGLQSGNDDGGHHPAADGACAHGQRHQIHAGTGDRGLHGRYRRNHLRRSVGLLLSACPRSAANTSMKNSGTCCRCCHDLHLETTALAIVSLLLVIFTPRIRGLSRLPGPLVAMLVATAAASAAGLARGGHDRQCLRRHPERPACASAFRSCRFQ